jgi:hypothetical protein
MPLVSYTTDQEGSRHSCAAYDALGQPPTQLIQAATEVLPGREYGVAEGHFMHAAAPAPE